MQFPHVPSVSALAARRTAFSAVRDLTSRVKSFVGPGGIDMPEVELPAGEHMVRVDIKDTDGRVGTTSFILKVVP